MAETENLIVLTVDLVAAHVERNSVSPNDLCTLIRDVHTALAGLNAPTEAEVPAKQIGAVSVRKSLSNPAHILSMIDGKPYKMLRRHLSQKGYTPESYRTTFGLPHGYPMVAPNYSEQRRATAKKIGLGRKMKPKSAAQKANSTASSAPVAKANPKSRRTLKPAFGKAVSDAKRHLGSVR